MRRPGQAKAGVLCVGRVYCDLVFTGLPRMPTQGTETFAGGLSVHPGGGAAITAAYLSALGRPAFLAAHLPAAPFDKSVSDGLTALGVDLSFCAPATSPEPQMTVAMVQGGDRAFLTRDVGKAIPPLDASGVRAAAIGHLHIGELKTLVERPDLLDLAESADLTVSLDCGWDDALTADVARLIERADLFLPNAEELAHLAGLGVKPAARKVTIVKRGAEGSAALGGARVRAPSACVLDTTGAGDAFNGGFVNAWLDGRPLETCQEAGNACGARAVAFNGGTAGAAALRQERMALPAAQ